MLAHLLVYKFCRSRVPLESTPLQLLVLAPSVVEDLVRTVQDADKHFIGIVDCISEEDP